MRSIKSVLSLLVVALLLVFVLQNGGVLGKQEQFRLDLLLRDFSPGPVPLYGVLLLAFVLGFCIGGTWWLGNHLRLRAQFKRVNRLLVEKGRELNSLRNLPVLEGQFPGKEEPAAARPCLAPGPGETA